MPAGSDVDQRPKNRDQASLLDSQMKDSAGNPLPAPTIPDVIEEPDPSYLYWKYAPPSKNPELAQAGKKAMKVRVVNDIEEDYELLFKEGRLWRARRIGVNMEVVIKKLPISRNAAREVSFMSRFCHSCQVPGLIHLLDLCRTEFDAFIVTESIGISIYDVELPESAKDSANLLIWFLYQCVQISHRMHQLGYQHGSLENGYGLRVDDSTGALFFSSFREVSESTKPCLELTSLCYLFSHLLIHHLESFDIDVRNAPKELQEFDSFLARMSTEISCEKLMMDPIFKLVKSWQVPSDAERLIPYNGNLVFAEYIDIPSSVCPIL